MPKKIIIAIVVILVAIVVFQFLTGNGKEEFESVEIVKGDVSEKISETGQVQKGEKINLSFKNAGRVEVIYAKVGESVSRGSLIAKLNTADLSIQLKEAEAALAIYQAKLDKLLAGAGQEEIKVAQTKVNNEQIDLDTAEQNLTDAYEDALNVLEDAYLKSYNAQNKADSVQRTYFIKSDQEGLTVGQNRDKIVTAASEIKSYLDKAKVDEDREDIDNALSQSEEELADISDALRIIRETCEEPSYRDTVSSADKTSLDTHRDNVNDALTDIVDAQQTIASKELAVDLAEGELQKAKDELAQLAAPPRQEDVSLYQSQVDQSQAQVDVLENQVEDAYLRSPVKGEIAEINKRVGELVQPVLQDVVATLLPDDPYEIEVNIYEEDIIKVQVENPVNISLVALPEKVFEGKVISIDPAEKLIDEVVYYKVIVAFDDTPEDIRPGMTADLIIKTASRENVLLVPEEAVQTKDGKTMVMILENGQAKEREVVLGLEGNDYFEVISGLQEGEEVILE